MLDRKFGHILPELVRFACDPHLDAMTRGWVFDALRQISGEHLGDDARVWRAWYAAFTGAELPACKELNQSLLALAWLQP